MEFVKSQKFGFIGLGNVGGKLAGSLIRNGCDLVLRDIGLFQDTATAHNVPLEISPILIKISKDGQNRFSAWEWSPNIIKRLEEACDNKVLAPGFPDEMTDDEPEEPGYEIIAKSWATDQEATLQLATAQFQKPKTGKPQGRERTEHTVAYNLLVI